MNYTNLFHLFAAPPLLCTAGFLMYHRVPSAEKWKLWPPTAPKPQIAPPEKLISSVTVWKIPEKASMKYSIWFRLGWCLPLHQSAVSRGAKLCSTTWQPQLYLYEGEVGEILWEERKGIRIFHSILPTERRPFNIGRRSFRWWEDSQPMSFMFKNNV